mgnify:CR=1 FL=1
MACPQTYVSLGQDSKILPRPTLNKSELTVAFNEQKISSSRISSSKGQHSKISLVKIDLKNRQL